jgi:hypothetical protein
MDYQSILSQIFPNWNSLFGNVAEDTTIITIPIVMKASQFINYLLN